MRFRVAGGYGRASLRRRRRPRGRRPVRPRSRCGFLLSVLSGVFVCGGVGGEARGRVQPSVRSLPGRVGAAPRRPLPPPEDARRPHHAGRAAPARRRRRRSHMPEPQPREQTAPAARPAAPGPGSRVVPPRGPGAAAPA